MANKLIQCYKIKLSKNGLMYDYYYYDDIEEKKEKKHKQNTT